jgi:hypothetical protein
VEEMPQKIQGELSNWGEDEMGHVVAYWVSEDGVSKLPWNYPECHLRLHLHDLVDWTYKDDYFGRNFLASSAAIGNANTANARTIYFTRTLFESSLRNGIEIPFPILASITNVALQLEAERQVDEETVRKQVRRHQAKAQSSRRKPDDWDVLLIAEAGWNLDGASETDLPY